MHGITELDRIVAAETDTIWHATETKAAGTLLELPAGLPAAERVERAAELALADELDNDVAGTVPIVATMPDGGQATIDTHLATVSRKGRVLGVVTKGYQILSGRTILDVWLRALARAGGLLEVLGTCDGGRQFFATFQVADAWKVPGDHSETRPHLNILSAHDGSRALLAMFAAFRVVCHNTAGMFAAEHERTTTAADRAKLAWCRVPHTLNAADRMADAVQWIIEGRARMETERDLLARLAARMISPAELEKFSADYLAIPEDVSSRTRTIREKQREEWTATLQDVDDLGNHAAGPNGVSAYGLLQAVTRFEDWKSPVRAKDQPVATRRAFRAFGAERETEKATARDRILELVGLR